MRPVLDLYLLAQRALASVPPDVVLDRRLPDGHGVYEAVARLVRVR